MDIKDLDINTLTLDELDALYDVLPEAMDALMSEKPKMTPKVLKGLAWLIGRRDNPDFTLEEAGKLTISAFGGADPKDGNEPSS